MVSSGLKPSCLAIARRVETKRSFEGEIQEAMASRGCSEPIAFLPFLAADVVTDVEVLAKPDLPKGRHRHERRCLHLHDQTAFVAAPSDLASRLAKQTIGRPGLANDVIPTGHPGSLDEIAEVALDGNDFPSGREVVVGGSFVAERGTDNDQITTGAARERTGIATGNNTCAPGGNDALERRCRQWGVLPWIEEPCPTALVPDPQQRHPTRQRHDDLAFMPSEIHEINEVTAHRIARNVSDSRGADRVEHPDRVGIELQNRWAIVHQPSLDDAISRNELIGAVRPWDGPPLAASTAISESPR